MSCVGVGVGGVVNCAKHRGWKVQVCSPELRREKLQAWRTSHMGTVVECPFRFSSDLCVPHFAGHHCPLSSSRLLIFKNLSISAEASCCPLEADLENNANPHFLVFSFPLSYTEKSLWGATLGSQLVDTLFTTLARIRCFKIMLPIS